MLELTYSTGLEGAKSQRTSRADRRICALVAALAAMARGDKVSSSGVRDPKQLPGLLASEFSKLNVPPDRAVLWARAMNGAKPDVVWPRKVLDKELAAYQMRELDALTAAGGGSGLKCGRGKTLVGVAAALGYAAKHGSRLYIVCPLNAVGAWRPYLDELRAVYDEVEVTSMDSSHHLEALDARPGGVLILDEVDDMAGTPRKPKARKDGTRGRNRAWSLHRLRRKFDVCVALTATFLHSGVERAWNMMDLVLPGAGRFANKWAVGEYFRCIVRNEWSIMDRDGTVRSKSGAKLEKPSGANFDRFAGFVGALFTIEEENSEASREMNAVEQIDHTVKLCQPWGSVHDDTVQVCKAWIKEHGEVPSAMKAVAELRKAGLTDKLDWVQSWLQEHDAEPLVLFAWSLDSIEQAEKRMESLGIPYLTVWGGASKKARSDAERRFQSGEVRVFIGQIRAASVSLNLHIACYSVTLDLSNRAKEWEQGKGRTPRRGQHRTCHHYDLIANALQQKVLDTLKKSVDFNAAVARELGVHSALQGASDG